jgi:predicted O-methyltransferase YrrM
MNSRLQQRIQADTDIHDHLVTLFVCAYAVSPEPVLEIGVGKGQSTLALLTGAALRGGHVVSLDITDQAEARALIASENLNPFWTFHVADSRTWQLEGPAPKWGLVFIDSSHTFSDTLVEISRFAPQTNLVLLHDTLSHPDVERAARQWTSSEVGWTYLTAHHNNGLGVLARRR